MAEKDGVKEREKERETENWAHRKRFLCLSIGTERVYCKNLLTLLERNFHDSPGSNPDRGHFLENDLIRRSNFAIN